MREKAIVVANKKEHAQIEIRPNSSCKGCRGCSAGKEGKPIRVWAKNCVNAKVGQVVEVELGASTFLSATLIVYAIPLLSFLAGIGLGYKISGLLNINSTEPFAILIGLVLMIISFASIHFFTRRREVENKYSPRIIRISNDNR